MKRWLGLAALGLGAYAVFVVATLPARHALGFALPALQQQNLTLAARGVTGSAWRGRASAVSVNGLELERVSWDLSLWDLAGGRIGGDWKASAGSAQLSGTGRFDNSGAVELEAVAGQLPAQLIASRLPVPASLEGRLQVGFEHLELHAGRPLSATGTVTWENAAVSAPASVALGTIRATLEPREGGGVVAHLADGGGPLQVGGTVEIDAQGQYRLEALLGTRPGADQALEQTLPILGRPAPDGRYRVTIAGRI